MEAGGNERSARVWHAREHKRSRLSTLNTYGCLCVLAGITVSHRL